MITICANCKNKDTCKDKSSIQRVNGFIKLNELKEKGIECLDYIGNKDLPKFKEV